MVVLVLAFAGGGWWIVGSLASGVEREPGADQSVLPFAAVEQREVRQVVTAEAERVETVVEVSAEATGDSDAVVTGLPVPVGSTVASGDVVAVVSGEPVFMLSGVLPAYRDLGPGTQGPDVAQLQATLNGLGLTGNRDPEGVFGPDTQAHVTELYERAGFPVPLTTPTAEDSLRSARRAVSDAEKAVEAAVAEDARARTAWTAEVKRAETAAAAAAGDVDRAIARGRDAVSLAEAEAAAERAAVDDLRSTGAPDSEIRAAQIAVATAEAAAREAIRSADAAAEAARLAADEATAAATSLAGTPPTATKDAAIVARDAARDSVTTALRSEGVILPRRNVVFVNSPTMTVHEVGVSVGQKVESGGTVLRLTTGVVQWRAAVSRDLSTLVDVGDTATGLDQTTGRRFDLRVTAVDSAPDRAGGAEQPADSPEPGTGEGADADGQARPDVVGGDDGVTASAIDTVTLTTTEQADVPIDLPLKASIEIVIAATDGPVLAVPVTAVSSLSDDSAVVRLLGEGDDSAQDIPVRLGLTGQGYVEIVDPDPRLVVGARVRTDGTTTGDRPATGESP